MSVKMEAASGIRYQTQSAPSPAVRLWAPYRDHWAVSVVVVGVGGLSMKEGDVYEIRLRNQAINSE